MPARYASFQTLSALNGLLLVLRFATRCFRYVSMFVWSLVCLPKELESAQVSSKWLSLAERSHFMGVPNWRTPPPFAIACKGWWFSPCNLPAFSSDFDIKRTFDILQYESLPAAGKFLECIQPYATGDPAVNCGIKCQCWLMQVGFLNYPIGFWTVLLVDHLTYRHCLFCTVFPGYITGVRE